MSPRPALTKAHVVPVPPDPSPGRGGRGERSRRGWRGDCPLTAGTADHGSLSKDGALRVARVAGVPASSYACAEQTQPCQAMARHEGYGPSAKAAKGSRWTLPLLPCGCGPTVFHSASSNTHGALTVSSAWPRTGGQPAPHDVTQTHDQMTNLREQTTDFFSQNICGISSLFHQSEALTAEVNDGNHAEVAQWGKTSRERPARSQNVKDNSKLFRG